MDSFVEIPEKDLPKLAEIYKKHIDWAPQVYGTITNGIKWLQMAPKRRLITFYSPFGKWEQDGSFVAIMQFECYDWYTFTLDPTMESLSKAFLTTNKLQIKDRYTLLYALNDNFVAPICKALKEKNITLRRDIPCYFFSISKDEAMQFNTECPPEVYTKELSVTNAAQINSTWPHRYPNSEKYLSTIIEVNGGTGLYLKSNDELVAWILISGMGQLFHLQTDENHRRKGYASLVTKIGAKCVARYGYDPAATVLVNNKASQSMFTKIGFKIYQNCNYLMF